MKEYRNYCRDEEPPPTATARCSPSPSLCALQCVALASRLLLIECGDSREHLALEELK